MRRSRGSGVENNRPNVRDDGDLQDGEHHEGRESADTDELERRTPPRGSVNHTETTRSIADSKTPLRAGPATAQMTTTKPAVMRVMRTQPGTSPRSEYELEK